MCLDLQDPEKVRQAWVVPPPTGSPQKLRSLLRLEGQASAAMEVGGHAYEVRVAPFAQSGLPIAQTESPTCQASVGGWVEAQVWSVLRRTTGSQWYLRYVFIYICIKLRYCLKKENGMAGHIL